MFKKNTHIHIVKKIFSFPSCPLEGKIICVIVARRHRGDIFSNRIKSDPVKPPRLSSPSRCPPSGQTLQLTVQAAIGTHRRHILLLRILKENGSNQIHAFTSPWKIWGSCISKLAGGCRGGLREGKNRERKWVTLAEASLASAAQPFCGHASSSPAFSSSSTFFLLRFSVLSLLGV